MKNFIRGMFIPVGLQENASRAARFWTLVSMYFMTGQLFKYEMSKLYYEETGALPSNTSPWRDMYQYFVEPEEWILNFYNPMIHTEASTSMAYSHNLSELLEKERQIIAKTMIDEDFVIGAPDVQRDTDR